MPHQYRHRRRILTRAVPVVGITILVACAAGSLPSVQAAAAAGPVPRSAPTVNPAAVLSPLPAIPRILDGRVTALALVGDRVVVGGTFTSVRGADGDPVPRRGLLAFSRTTGVLDEAFAPEVRGGDVAALAPAAGGGVLVGGDFDGIGTVSRPRLARVALDGTVDIRFAPAPNARISAIATRGRRIFVGGPFTRIGRVARAHLAELDPVAGGALPTLDVPLEGNAVALAGAVSVQALRVSPDGSTLAVAHNAERVGGAARRGVALLDVTGRRVRLLPWATSLWADLPPRAKGIVRVTGVAWGPDSRWIVTVNSGGDVPPVGDCVQRFEVRPGGGSTPVAPTWVTRQFDTSWAVAVGRDGTVYTGGHFHYTEAPGAPVPWPGDDGISYGWGPKGGAAALGASVVGRLELSALDPATGSARNWYQSADGHLGVTALLVDRDRLIVGGDGEHVSGMGTGRAGWVPAVTAKVPEGPSSEVSDPLLGAVVPVGPVVLRGRARATGGVTAVDVEVKRGESWWRRDGTWGGYDTWPATLGRAQDGGRRSWTLRLPALEAGQYLLFPRATGRDGTTEAVRHAVPVEVLDGTLAAPTVSITSPTDGQSDFADHKVTLRGTATDADGVQVVRLALFESKLDRYLQPDGTLGGYASQEATLADPGATTTAWSRTVRIPDGTWTLVVTATDGKDTTTPRGYLRSFVMAAGG